MFENKNKTPLLQKIRDFIKYHNAFNLILLAIFLITTSTFAASPDVRQGVATVFISKTETVKSVDNHRLVTSDLDTLNPQLQIISISDDSDNYYVVYRYNTLSIQNYVWSDVTEEKTLKIAKAQLGPHDLGLYIANKLADVVSYELEYLKKAQGLEKQNGETQKVATIAYSGLIGKFLNPEEKVFPGYEPIVKETKPEPTPISEPAVPTVSIPTPTPTPVPVSEVPASVPALASTVSVIDLGSSPIPAQGITIYDRVTNQPKCLFVYNGGIGIADGLCNESKDTNTNTNSPAVIPVETPVSNPIPAPIETSNPPAAIAPEVLPIEVPVPDVVPTGTTTQPDFSSENLGGQAEAVVISDTSITATTTP